MQTFIISGIFALCAISLVFFAVYKIKPQTFRFHIEICKRIFAMNIEMRAHLQSPSEADSETAPKVR